MMAPFFLTIAIATSANEDVSTRVVTKLREISAMREGLAQSLSGKDPKTITQDDFKRTCGAVGKTLQAWAKEHGYTVRQVSQKNRNPANRPNTLEAQVLERFRDSADLDNFAAPGPAGSPAGTFHFVRINLHQSCLACHGPKNRRPDFIVRGYPADLAFDFQPGDLRGMFSVFVPK